jgi:hypothetical protein
MVSGTSLCAKLMDSAINAIHSSLLPPHVEPFDVMMISVCVCVIIVSNKQNICFEKLQNVITQWRSVFVEQSLRMKAKSMYKGADMICDTHTKTAQL